MTDEYDPLNEDIDKLMAATGAAAGGGGDDEEYLGVDYDPMAQVMPEGDLPGFLVGIGPSQTKAGKPTCLWKAIAEDKKYPFERSKNIPIAQGNGIERLNLQFTKALGLECPKLPNGQYGIPLKEIRKKIESFRTAGMPGMPITMRISHRPRDDGGVWDDLNLILAREDAPLNAPPDLDKETVPADDFGDEPF